MKFSVSAGPLLCQSCGGEAIDEQDLYTGYDGPATTTTIGGLDSYAANDPLIGDPHFFPATALCTLCLLLKVPPVPGRWDEDTIGGQS